MKYMTAFRGNLNPQQMQQESHQLFQIQLLIWLKHTHQQILKHLTSYWTPPPAKEWTKTGKVQVNKDD